MAAQREPTKPAPGMLRRFQFSLGANLARGALSFVNGIIIARAIGAASYGDLNFLLASFTSIIALADMGGGSAFFSFLAGRSRHRRFFAVYALMLAAQFCLTAAVVLWLPGGWFHMVWVGQHRGLVLLAFLASFLSIQIWNAFIWLGEALRRTGLVQSLNVARAGLHTLLLLAAFGFGWLDLKVVLWLLAVEYAAFVAFFARGLLRANLDAPAAEPPSYRAIAREFLRYCQPLILYVWVCFIYTFADRWLLQTFGGSIQQGLFSIGQQFSTIALLVTRSVLNVFWKEVAEASEIGDRARLERVYRVVVKGVYLVAAFICAAMVPYSREILRVALGMGFVSGAACLSLMFLYPVHQSLGQVQAAFFYATRDTRMQTLMGVVTMALSLPAAYLLLAPRTAAIPGLGLGALGLAVKLVMVQIVVINLQAWVIDLRHGWRHILGFQLVLPVLLGVALLSRQAVTWAATLLHFGHALFWIAGLGIGGYCVAAVALLLAAPGIAGFRREEVVEIWHRLAPRASRAAA